MGSGLTGALAALGGMAQGFAEPAIKKQFMDSVNAAQQKKGLVDMYARVLDNPEATVQDRTQAAQAIQDLISPPAKGKKGQGGGKELSTLVGGVSTMLKLGKQPQASPQNTHQQAPQGMGAVPGQPQASAQPQGMGAPPSAPQTAAQPPAQSQAPQRSTFQYSGKTLPSLSNFPGPPTAEQSEQRKITAQEKSIQDDPNLSPEEKHEAILNLRSAQPKSGTQGGLEERAFDEAKKDNPSLTRLQFHKDWESASKSGSMKIEARGIKGEAINDQSVDAFGRPIDPKQSYDRVQTASGLVYMPGAAAKEGNPSLISLIVRANHGDKDAVKDLRTYQNMANERAEAFGKGRAQYQLNQYIDEDTGNPVTLSNVDAANQIKGGKNLMITGKLPFQTAVAVQQLMSEATPALSGVRDNLGAFDNTEDRAIFARLLKGAGLPTYGAEDAWLGTVLNQSLTEHLSPQGKQLAVNLRRLNETMGRLRSTIGLPATESAMAMTLSLLPGPSTPDSNFAGKQIDQLESIINQAVDIPVYGRGRIAGKRNAGPPGPPAVAGGTLPPQARSALKEGVKTTFKNGQTWTLQGGQPVQVQ